MYPSSPVQPWDAVVYFDEATPGAVLHLDNHRKIWCIYVTFLNFGPAVVQHEQAWIPLAILRTDIAKNLVGGLSRALARLLDHNFDLIRTEGALVTRKRNYVSRSRESFDHLGR